MEHDDKCFHPSSVSLSVSLLVRSETGYALTWCQEDKLFCDGSKDKKGEQAPKKKKIFEKCQLNTICQPGARRLQTMFVFINLFDS